MTTNPHTYTIHFYDIALAEESDPDPTWVLNNCKFNGFDDALRRMIRFCEILFDKAPLTFEYDPSLKQHGVAEYIISHEKVLGTMYIAEETK
jgi:hypothetical protein